VFVASQEVTHLVVANASPARQVRREAAPVITTGSNELVADIHERIDDPSIIEPIELGRGASSARKPSMAAQ